MFCLIAKDRIYSENQLGIFGEQVKLGLDLCVKRSYTKEKCRYVIILFYCKGLIVVFNFRYRYFKCKW